MTPEKIVKAAISRFLKEQGCYYHMHVPVGYGKTTIDYLGCYKGLFFGIEAKREKGGVLSCTQERIILAIQGAGGRAWIEDSPNLEKTMVQFGLMRETMP